MKTHYKIFSPPKILKILTMINQALLYLHNPESILFPLNFTKEFGLNFAMRNYYFWLIIETKYKSQILLMQMGASMEELDSSNSFLVQSKVQYNH